MSGACQEKNFDIENIVKRYLETELRSGDSTRMHIARKAIEANNQLGIGNWCWSKDLGIRGLGRAENGGGEIIPLVELKIK